MSKTKIPLSDARAIAERLVAQYCPPRLVSRVVIAGSIRRKKALVGDIEIVAQPTLSGGLFGDEPNPAFYQFLDDNPPGQAIKAGRKYRQYALPEGVNLDLFLVTPPASWGVILAIRTGPAHLSQLMVTPKIKGGLLPSWARVEAGSVVGAAQVLKMPEEEDFLQFIGLTGLSPEEREARYGD